MESGIVFTSFGLFQGLLAFPAMPNACKTLLNFMRNTIFPKGHSQSKSLEFFSKWKASTANMIPQEERLPQNLKKH